MPKKIPEPLIQLIEKTITDLMQQIKVPGLSIAVLQGDEIIYSKAFGARNLEQNNPVTLNTLFGIGSCTKSFTALGIMLLQQEGKLNISDPISKYLPVKLDKKSAPLTIHHLLSHSSGLPNLHAADILILRYLGFDDSYVPLSSWEDFFHFVNGAKNEIKSIPGENYYYCNSGFTLLQKVIEEVSGLKYAEFIDQKILKPLNMVRSTYLQEDFDKETDKMTAYGVGVQDGKTITKALMPPFDEFIHGPGGLISSVNEMTNYLKLYLNEGNFEGKSIINKELLDQMLKSHIYRGNTYLVGKSGYGYGWGTFEEFAETRLIAHTGSTGVSGAIMAFLPKEKFGIAGVINSGTAEILVVIAFMILMILVGKDPMKDFPIISIQEKLEMLTGRYASYKGIEKVNVKKTGGYLTLEILSNVDLIPDRRYPLIPLTEKIEDFNFFFINELGLRQPVEFKVEAPKKIDLIIERNIYHRIKDF